MKHLLRCKAYADRCVCVCGVGWLVVRVRIAGNGVVSTHGGRMEGVGMPSRG